jgi:hypothetical protein
VLRVAILIVLWAVVGLVVPVATLGLVAVLSPFTTRIRARRAPQRMASVLPADASIVGYATAVTPPARYRGLLRLWVISTLFGPLGLEAAFFFFYRWYGQREVVVTSDDTAWVIRNQSHWRPRKGKVIVGRGHWSSWRPTRVGRLSVEAALAGEELGLLPGATTAELAGRAFQSE